MIGINDLAEGTPDSVIITNYESILTNIQTASPQTKVYVQSILPTNADFTEFSRHQHKDAHIQNLNAALQKLCAGKGLSYIDLYTRFVNSEGKLNRKYTNDGLHINGYGYMLWKQIIEEKGYLK